MITDDLDVSILQLRCFLAVVEAGSVALAARRLGMASPSVSRAITRLEKERSSCCTRLRGPGQR